jgi:hypothetical protein
MHCSSARANGHRGVRLGIKNMPTHNARHSRNAATTFAFREGKTHINNQNKSSPCRNRACVLLHRAHLHIHQRRYWQTQCHRQLSKCGSGERKQRGRSCPLQLRKKQMLRLLLLLLHTAHMGALLSGEYWPLKTLRRVWSRCRSERDAGHCGQVAGRDEALATELKNIMRLLSG